MFEGKEGCILAAPQMANEKCEMIYGKCAL